jgi:hypothetical protein
MKNWYVWSLVVGLIAFSVSGVSSAAMKPISSDRCAPISSIRSYKTIFFKGEVPSAWSYVTSKGDIGFAPLPTELKPYFSPDFIASSLAENGIAYGDVTSGQADFYFVKGSEMTQYVLIQKTRKTEGVKWETEKLLGKTVDVEFFATQGDDHWTGSQENSGQIFYLSWSGKNGIGKQQNFGLIIFKQPSDQAFDQGFRHFLRTMDLKQAGLISPTE